MIVSDDQRSPGVSLRRGYSQRDEKREQRHDPSGSSPAIMPLRALFHLAQLRVRLTLAVVLLLARSPDGLEAFADPRAPGHHRGGAAMSGSLESIARDLGVVTLLQIIGHRRRRCGAADHRSGL